MKKLFIPILILFLVFACTKTQTYDVSAQGAGANSTMFSGIDIANLDYGFTYTENAVAVANDSVSSNILIEWPATRLFIYSDGAAYFNWATTDTSTDVIDSLASLQLPATTLTIFTVPWGLTNSNDDTLYLHLRAVTLGDSIIVRNATG